MLPALLPALPISNWQTLLPCCLLLPAAACSEHNLLLPCQLVALCALLLLLRLLQYIGLLLPALLLFVYR
jgi:hypothetical protein